MKFGRFRTESNCQTAFVGAGQQSRVKLRKR